MPVAAISASAHPLYFTGHRSLRSSTTCSSPRSNRRCSMWSLQSSNTWSSPRPPSGTQPSSVFSGSPSGTHSSSRYWNSFLSQPSFATHVYFLCIAFSRCILDISSKCSYCCWSAISASRWTLSSSPAHCGSHMECSRHRELIRDVFNIHLCQASVSRGVSTFIFFLFFKDIFCRINRSEAFQNSEMAHSFGITSNSLSIAHSLGLWPISVIGCIHSISLYLNTYKPF